MKWQSFRAYSAFYFFLPSFPSSLPPTSLPPSLFLFSFIFLFSFLSFFFSFYFFHISNHPSLHWIVLLQKNHKQHATYHTDPWLIKGKSEWYVAFRDLKCGTLVFICAVSIKCQISMPWNKKMMLEILVILLCSLFLKMMVFRICWVIIYYKDYCVLFLLISKNVASMKWTATFVAHFYFFWVLLL